MNIVMILHSNHFGPFAKIDDFAIFKLICNIPKMIGMGKFEHETLQNYFIYHTEAF